MKLKLPKRGCDFNGRNLLVYNPVQTVNHGLRDTKPLSENRKLLDEDQVDAVLESTISERFNRYECCPPTFLHKSIKNRSLALRAFWKWR